MIHYMKTLQTITIFLVLLVALQAGCRRSETQLFASAVVAVHYPESFTRLLPGAVAVTATGISTGVTTTVVTDEETGVAAFSQLIPGDYLFTAEVTLSEEQTEELTGTSDELYLHATSTVNVGLAAPPVVRLQLQGAPAGGLVFKEVYYTCSPSFYFHEQFIELFNNSDEVVYLDQLMIADAYGVAGLINPTSLPSVFAKDKNSVYVANIWRIPGSGTEHPLQPGESIVIAQDAANHKELNAPESPIDLSNADWETYVLRPDNRDVDNPDVPNLERIHFTGGFDWNFPVFGAALILFHNDHPEQLERVPDPDYPEYSGPYIKVPLPDIVDSFEGLKDAGSVAFKRIPPARNAGFVYASGTYTKESFRRKVREEKDGRKILVNTNNSGNDFEKIPLPTPGSFD